MAIGSSSFYQGDVYAHYLHSLSSKELSTEFRSATRMESSIDKTRILWSLNVEMYHRAREQMARHA